MTYSVRMPAMCSCCSPTAFAEFVGETLKPASALKFTNIGGILKLPLESGGLDSVPRYRSRV